MTGKHHTREDIAAKLGRAAEMAKEGKSTVEIAKALGVSTMTYHRWRKLLEQSGRARPVHGPNGADENWSARIDELRTENARLRRLVTDLLLEKVSLEEKIAGKEGRG